MAALFDVINMNIAIMDIAALDPPRSGGITITEEKRTVNIPYPDFFLPIGSLYLYSLSWQPASHAFHPLSFIATLLHPLFTACVTRVVEFRDNPETGQEEVIRYIKLTKYLHVQPPKIGWYQRTACASGM